MKETFIILALISAVVYGVSDMWSAMTIEPLHQITEALER